MVLKPKKRNRTKSIMNQLDPLSLGKGQALRVTLNGNVDVELRVTPLGQPEVYCDHTQIIRLFRDWYQPNETC